MCSIPDICGLEPYQDPTAQIHETRALITNSAIALTSITAFEETCPHYINCTERSAVSPTRTLPG